MPYSNVSTASEELDCIFNAVDDLLVRTEFLVRRAEAELGSLVIRNQIRADMMFDPLFMYED